MANSQYEYVKKYETHESVLPNSWFVVRVDGRSFHQFSALHEFHKPVDMRAARLMDQCAAAVMRGCGDIVFAIGMSDEYSFVFRRESELFGRRIAKVTTSVVSEFTANFVFHWSCFFPDQKMRYPPTFDGRLVAYPTDDDIKNYLRWRQVDCHINYLYNLTFSCLVKSGLTESAAHKKLVGTFSSDKQEILFSQFGINYNNEPECHKKSAILIRPHHRLEVVQAASVPQQEEIKQTDPEDHCRLSSHTHRDCCPAPPSPARQGGASQTIVVLHEDIIKEKFWVSTVPSIIPYVSAADHKKSLRKLHRRAAAGAGGSSGHPSRGEQDRQSQGPPDHREAGVDPP